MNSGYLFYLTDKKSYEKYDKIIHK